MLRKVENRDGEPHKSFRSAAVERSRKPSPVREAADERVASEVADLGRPPGRRKHRKRIHRT
jgi:hypothetical protein